MIRWGVVGPGTIAAGFAEAMGSVEGGEIVAVASRSLVRAEAFADKFGIPRRYGEAAAMADDPDVDVVYVATPPSRHEQDTVAFLAAGKHVMCEKPFALNAEQARRMAHEARARRLFLMEAIWSRFLPSYRTLVDVLDSGRIGEPLLVEADFGFRMPVDPAHRLFRPELGGGALLDLGIYPVQLCLSVLGPVVHVVADGEIGRTGVDEQVAAVLRHSGGGLGVVKAAIRTSMSCTARIAGSDGTIDIPAPMHWPQALTVTTHTGGSERIDASYEGNGLRFEIDEVHRCLAHGLTESPVMTLDETIALASTLDAVRARIPAGGTRSTASSSGAGLAQ
ncbi:Gfo/Idh/MocA family protein [Streptomyces sp. NBC_01261]|uniref:Gfo/Idh/MocA family protein n=1 Tax=Streptomyces sp. NBC_01261 TaxID=2903802 RepID=UPI002E3721D5|nr:Gfo/Idh/MocA family oxidoreductase [Streptomyces sp. NBC_01261]